MAQYPIAFRLAPMLPGISVVLPVRNGAPWLEAVLAGIVAQRWPGDLQIIAIDDGSTDASREILARHAACGRLTLLDGGGRGAAAAINTGVRAARHDLIAQIDQDVVLQEGWLTRLVAALDDPAVAAAQGRYVADPHAGPWARVMALDLTARYARLGPRVNHVCTGNSVYRRAALLAAGLFDERMGYGYDNDMSYRLTGAGFALAFVPDATSVHHWRDGLAAYARQQYGFGYGRLDLLRRHRGRLAGDDVSPLRMMLQAPVTACALGLAGVAAIAAATGWPFAAPALASAALAAALAADRTAAGVGAALRFGDPAGFSFLPAHLVRNVAWVAATVVWAARAIAGNHAQPLHSMQPRGPASTACAS